MFVGPDGCSYNLFRPCSSSTRLCLEIPEFHVPGEVRVECVRRTMYLSKGTAHESRRRQEVEKEKKLKGRRRRRTSSAGKQLLSQTSSPARLRRYSTSIHFILHLLPGRQHIEHHGDSAHSPFLRRSPPRPCQGVVLVVKTWQCPARGIPWRSH